MSIIRVIAVALVTTSLAGCASDPYGGPRQDAGAIGGAVAGGIIGSSVAGGGVGSRLAGAAIGAAAGGIIGGAIGAALDEQDRQMAYEAEMRALETGRPGAPVGWRSRRTAYYGTVVPGDYYEQRGRRCREYTHTIYINGQPRAARGVACRNPDGSWTPID